MSAKTTRRNPATIKTEALGTLSWSKFQKMLRENDGNQSALARSISAETKTPVAPGTVRKWKAALERERSKVLSSR